MIKYYLIFFILLVFNTIQAYPLVLNQEDPVKIVISGILIDNEAQPVKNTEMETYVGTAETVLKADPSKKKGALTLIEGTGKINLSIVDIEGGGAIKLIDGGIANPRVKTNDQGEFRFELTQKFLEGEQILIITSPKNNNSNGITESFPILNKDGKPWLLIIEDLPKVFDLGKVKILEK